MLNLFHRNRKKVFSSRSPQYRRIFAQACWDGEFVQEVLAQLPCCHQLGLPDKLSRSESCRWRAAKTIERNWSSNGINSQIETVWVECCEG